MEVKLKPLDDLPNEIYKLLENPKEIPPEAIEYLAKSLSKVITDQITASEQEPRLRFSNIGTPCKRKLWYSVRTPQLAEPLPGNVRFKFLYGHILEVLVLWLANLAGYDVYGEQDELELAGIKGHRDAAINGITVDVKSATTNSFKKFQQNRLDSDDPFGYMDQIQAYNRAAEDVRKDTVAFIAIDKQLGHICVDQYPANDVDYEKKIEGLKEIIAQDEPPERAFSDVSYGTKGNKKLGLNCSYCPFKKTCWPGLRTFVYSNGPVFMSKVVDEPSVPEAKNGGKF